MNSKHHVGESFRNEYSEPRGCCHIGNCRGTPGGYESSLDAGGPVEDSQDGIARQYVVIT